MGGKYVCARNASRRSDVGLLHMGADWLFNPDLVLGMLGQVDWTDQRDRAGNAEVKGTGWMLGPYVVARLPHNLTFDGRAAFGTSGNEVNPFGDYTDDFSTTRWLVRGRLTGSFDLDRFKVNPFVQFLYFGETQKAYTDSASPRNRIPKQTVSLGRVKFGPRVSSTFVGKDGLVISPHATLSGLLDFNRSARIEGAGPDREGGSRTRFRARLEGGVGILMRGGWRLNGEAFYDGIGRKSFENYGVGLKLTVPFSL